MALFERFGLEFSKMRVLFVEDNEFALNLGKTALEELGFGAVVVARDGQEAIETIERFPNINLIISDWNMPEVSGIELLRIARERWPGIPFVMITSNDSVEHVAEARRSGVFAYVLKPFTLQGLRQKIIAAIRRRLADGGDKADDSDFIYLEAIDQIEAVTDNIGDDPTLSLPRENVRFEDAMETLLFSAEGRERHVGPLREAAAALVAQEGLDADARALIGALTDQLQKFIETVGVPNAVQIEIVKLHVESIRAVNLGRLGGKAGVVGPGLVKGLSLAMAKTAEVD